LRTLDKRNRKLDLVWQLISYLVSHNLLVQVSLIVELEIKTNQPSFVYPVNWRRMVDAVIVAESARVDESSATRASDNAESGNGYHSLWILTSTHACNSYRQFGPVNKINKPSTAMHFLCWSCLRLWRRHTRLKF
jgi:hypothetical protein